MDIALIAAQFSQPHAENYYNTAGSALMPASIRAEMADFFESQWSDNLASYGRYAPCRERLRRNLAGMMNAAAPEEVAILHHTAEGASVIANGLDWRPGDVILTLDREYPSTIYPWMNLEKLRGVRLVLLAEENGRLDEEEIAAAIRRERPRLFAISAVEWCSGYRFDLEPIGRACEECGAFFFVDSAQALGFTPMDVRAWRISAMAGSAWKWLFGPFGQGYLYLQRDLLGTVTPLFVGSESVVNHDKYLDFDFTFQPDMRRFEYSSANLSGLVWFDAGVRFVQSLDADALRDHVFALQDCAIGRLREKGCLIRGDQPPLRRSGIMAFRHPGRESRELAQHLYKSAGIFARERDGFVRLAFHLYNSEAGIDRLAAQL